MWHRQALADFNHIKLVLCYLLGVDCLLIIVICYSYFITCLHDFPFRTFRYDSYINRLADTFHQYIFIQ